MTFHSQLSIVICCVCTMLMANSVSKMAIILKITLFIFLIILKLVVCVPLSPCQSMFHYEYDGRSWIGVLKISSHIYSRFRGSRMSVKMLFAMPYTRRIIPINNDTSKLELYQSMDTTFTQILLNAAINFRVTFPDNAISPTLLNVIVNAAIHCSNTATARDISSYTLQYSLVLPTAQMPFASTAATTSTRTPMSIELNDQSVNEWFDRSAIAPLSAGSSTQKIGISTSSLDGRQQSESICGRLHTLHAHTSPSSSIHTQTVDQSIGETTWPWLVAIYLKKVQGVDFQCTGTLITNKLVLTAAHCFWLNTKRNPADVLLVMGRYDLRNWTEENAVLSDAHTIYVHPDFIHDGQRFDADIAIVRPKETFAYTAWIRPLCLLPPNHHHHHHMSTAANAAEMPNVATLVGWRQSSDHRSNMKNLPRLIRMLVVSRTECVRRKSSLRQVTSDRSFCGARASGDHGPCKHDVGAALAVSRNGLWFLRGIFSVALANPSMNNCDLDRYVIFTDVTKFTPWISQFL